MNKKGILRRFYFENLMYVFVFQVEEKTVLFRRNLAILV